MILVFALGKKNKLVLLKIRHQMLNNQINKGILCSFMNLLWWAAILFLPT